ncbi:MAG TPA: Gfo/Idh/MocA family oxidoreductase [Thermomicrobiales bacterium]|jgi:UDP-N-acetylglucosamine 3-dehydrogenase|nr:Gfo/Idh/MocA family oxidoreductase [Thermomicrobiales bacterium]
MTNVAVLGAGFMGSTHARAYAKLDDVSVAAIYAHSGNRAEPLAAELGSRWTSDLEGILADPAIDAVDICLPTPEHRPLLEAALAAGKHVLLEKPLALTLEDGRAVVEAATQAAAKGQVVMIAHVLRFWPEYRKAQEIVASGELGAPISGFASRRQAYPAWSALFAQSGITGGAIVDQMVHDFDALNWVLGQPRTVMAHGILNPRSGGFDQSQVLIGYDAATAATDGGMVMPDSYPFSSRFEILCESGAVEYHFQAGGRSVEVAGGTNALTVYRNEGDPERVEVEQTDAYENEIAAFIACVREGRQPEQGTPADAFTALQVAVAAKTSAETGQLVTLD